MIIINNYLITITLILSLVIYYIYAVNNKNAITISLIIISLLALTSLIYPTFSFILMLILSIGLLLLTMPFTFYETQRSDQIKILIALIEFLAKTKVLEVLARLYIMFSCGSPLARRARLGMLLVCGLIYMITSRWYFYHARCLNESFELYQLIVIYIIIFIGIMSNYIRLTLTISSFLVNVTCIHKPKLLSPVSLYIMGELDEDPIPPEKPIGESGNNNKRFSLINIDRTRYYYRQTFSSSSSTSSPPSGC